MQIILASVSYSGAGSTVTTVKWASGTLNKLTINITPSMGFSLQDGTGGSGTSLNGFVVLDNASPLTVSSTTISGNSVVLTMSANIPQADIVAGMVTMQYEFGQTPHGVTNLNDLILRILYLIILRRRV